MNRIEGDKVVWMIMFLLILISIVTIFSSTPLLARESDSSRLKILKDQLLITGLGLGLIFLCNSIKSIGVFKFFSRFGFLVSIGMLLVLTLRIKTPLFSAGQINDAWRIIKVGGLQIHVYEIVKVAMIMYLSWVLHSFKENKYMLTDFFADRFERLSWLRNPFVKNAVYVYIPILSVTMLIFIEGTSSALFVMMIMLITLYVGGLNMKDIAAVGATLVGLIALVVVLYYSSGEKIVLSNRLITAIGRVTSGSENKDRMITIQTASRNSKEFQDALDKLRQPVSAQLAIKEGGIFGKGPGHSTQRYVVPVIFGDYMYSFIIEEYGLFGGIIILILYVSLLARGSLIARNCENHFAKTAVAGLIILISAQAFMHMAVNVHLLPQTGQTLPLISHGSSSFLAFCIAFGIILSISRMVHRKLQKQAAEAAPIIEARPDEIHDRLDELDALETFEAPEDSYEE